MVKERHTASPIRCHGAHIVFEFEKISEAIWHRFGVNVSSATLRDYVVFNKPILNERKHTAASIVVTDVLVEFARVLNAHILKQFGSQLSIQDLLPTGQNLKHDLTPLNLQSTPSDPPPVNVEMEDILAQ